MKLYERIARHGFNFAKKTSGTHSIEIIHPIEDWVLPAGYSYSPRDDAIVDEAGNPISLSECSAFWITRSVSVIHIPPQPSEVLLMPGEITVGTISMYVQDMDAFDLLSRAFGLVGEEIVYRINGIQPFPTDNPSTLLVTATRYGVL